MRAAAVAISLNMFGCDGVPGNLLSLANGVVFVSLLHYEESLLLLPVLRVGKEGEDKNDLAVKRAPVLRRWRGVIGQRGGRIVGRLGDRRRWGQ